MQELPSSYRDFINSEFPTEAAEVLGSVENLTPEQVKVFESCIILYLLFFIDKKDITSILIDSEVPETAAGNLVSAFHKSLPEFAQQKDDAPATSSQRTLEEEIRTVEDTLESVSGLRTMAGDVSLMTPPPVGTYQSTQAEILNRPDTPSAAQPAPMPNPDNRWDSASR